MQSLVVDNFFPYPNVIRSWALTNKFYNAKEFSERIGQHTSWPGVRTDHIMDLDIDYANVVLTEVSNLATKNFMNAQVSIKSYFQVCTSSDGDSWVHQDNDVDVAAVLYLTPNAPVSSGTTIYRCNDHNAWHSLDIDEMKKLNRFEDRTNYEKIFTPIDVFGNVYNRLIMYKGDEFHKSNDYFGSSIQDGRLTQVFFLKFER